MLDPLRPWCELRVLGHQPEMLLPRQGFVAILVPAFVEFALVLIAPFFWSVMRRVQSSWREIYEERLVRRHRVLKAHPGDRLISHVGHEVVSGGVRWLDMRYAVEDKRRPLIGLAAEKPVKLFEAVADGPARKRPGDAHLPCRGLMHLAEGRGVVAVQLQDFGNRHGLIRTDGIVSGGAGCHFGNRAHPDRMMIVAGKQGLASRRA